MSPQVYAKRISAIKLADTLNKIEALIEQKRRKKSEEPGRS